MVNSIKKLNIWKGKVYPKTCHKGTEREYSYSSPLSLTSALDASGRSTPYSGPFTPGRVASYLMYRRLGGHQGPTGRVLRRENLLPLPKFES